MEWLILVAVGIASFATPLIAVSLFTRYDDWMARLISHETDALDGPAGEKGRRELGRATIGGVPFRPSRVQRKSSDDGLPGQALWPRRVISSRRQATPAMSPGSRLGTSILGIGLHNTTLQPSCAAGPTAHLPAPIGRDTTTPLAPPLSLGGRGGPLAPILSLHERRERTKASRQMGRAFMPASMAGASLLITLSLIFWGLADLVLVQYMISFGLCLLVWGLTANTPAGEAQPMAHRRIAPRPADAKRDDRTDLPLAA